MPEKRSKNFIGSEYAFQQNEERANIQMSNMLLASGISLVLVWVMYMLKFLTTMLNSWYITGAFLGTGLLLLLIWYICGNLYYNKPWSKYVILSSILVIAGSIMTFDIIFSLLFFVVVEIVACRYYDKKFLLIMTMLCIAVLFASNFIAAYTRPLFSDTNSVVNWLKGRTGNQFENILVRLFIPEALGLLLVVWVGAYVSNDGKRILEEQEKIFAMKAQAEVELADSRSLLMLSQIQPHFLFNTLNSIYYLCDKDINEAKDSIDKFATYLRMNVDTLSNKEMVSVKKELEHVEIYLYLEKIRFEERLNYVFEVESTNFMIPPLTIQPLVENAVKHGVIKKREGGTVWVNIREDENNIYIVVKDDGIGFDVNAVANDGKTHVGLVNIKHRLESMCHATIDTVSVIGEGTTVTITMPKDKGEN